MEKYEKKQTFQYCEIRNVMVRLEVIQSTATLPDLVNAVARLVPTGCDKASRCRQERVSCMVLDPNGGDPCPGFWDSGL